ncbi:MAG: putative glycosyltransferase EpsH [Candidatus Hydrogenedentes bacterium ADurb.Bin101]|jgi:GT2 family glycosyltransferase|nr:MAG: putative glycosyltransferase EpsH [Candidatus Hydrogenedentes bacterium ADurb.Bin101]
MNPPELTVVIPSYNPRPDLLRALYDSLMRQSFNAFEVVIVDDASTEPSLYKWIQDPRFRVLRQKENRGPAACRNLGAKAAESQYLFFTDTDCELAPDTLQKAADGLRGGAILMGNTITRAVTPFGKAVALLGFPGGGLLGFNKVWRVDEDGYTNSFSSCNLAFRKTVFEALGGFDETFPVAGGEDTVLAWKATQTGCRIRYVPEMQVYHIEKSTLGDFIRWQITRGRGNYHIKQQVGRVGGYLRLRMWTFKNSLRAAGFRYALPVLGLILLSVYYQVKGMCLETRDARKRRA